MRAGGFLRFYGPSYARPRPSKRDDAMDVKYWFNDSAIASFFFLCPSTTRTVLNIATFIFPRQNFAKYVPISFRISGVF